MSKEDVLKIGCQMCSKKYDEFHKYMGKVALSLNVNPSILAITMIAQALGFEIAVAREGGLGVETKSLVKTVVAHAEEMVLKKADEDDDEGDEFKNDPEIE